MSDSRFPGCRIHPTALIEDGVSIGDGTSVWDNVHLRRGASIGKGCIIGEKTYVAYDVHIGNYCKLNANVYVCAGVTIADYVMVAAHVVFTNERYPRAFDRVLDGLARSEPTEDTLLTQVDRGVTIGANATIGPGLRLGRYAMVGMGSVVTREVPAHGLVIGGRPERLVGYVCACGPLLVRIGRWETDPAGTSYECVRCGRVYQKGGSGPEEVRGPESAGVSNTSR